MVKSIQQMGGTFIQGYGQNCSKWCYDGSLWYFSQGSPISAPLPLATRHKGSPGALRGACLYLEHEQARVIADNTAASLKSQ